MTPGQFKKRNNFNTMYGGDFRENMDSRAQPVI